MRLLAWFVPTLAAFAFALPAFAQQKDAVQQTLSALVTVQSRVPPEARSAATLGTQRRGNGVLIREGYVLTIGYLVMEAESIQVTGADGRTISATLAAVDHPSGLGVLKLAEPLAGTPLPLGDDASLGERDPVLVAGAAGPDDVAIVHVVSRRAFAGSWEYLLDSAIFTFPAVRGWSGAALIGPKGELLGIGSLVVPDAGGPGTQSPGNLFVPVSTLKPALEGLIANGKRNGAARPWLGVNADEVRGRLFVGRVSPGSPADRAGLKPGDIVLAVGEDEVTSLEQFYRKLWSRGAAGVEVPLKVLQGARVRDVPVRSIDREGYFRPSKTQ